jgi:hypothetical protein
MPMPCRKLKAEALASALQPSSRSHPELPRLCSLLAVEISRRL